MSADGLRHLADDELLFFIAEGEPEALEAVDDRYVSPVWQLALVACRNGAAASRLPPPTWPTTTGTGADADPDAEPGDAPCHLDLRAVLADFIAELQARAHRSLSVVLRRERCAEKGEHPIPRKVLDVPPESLNL